MDQKNTFISQKAADSLSRFHLFFAPIVVIGLIGSLIAGFKFLSIFFGVLVGIAFIINIILHFAEKQIDLYKINGSDYE